MLFILFLFLSKTCPPYFAWLCLFNLFFLVEFNSFLSYRFSTILWTAIKMQIFSSKGFIFKWTIFFRFVFGGIVYFFRSSQRHWFVYAAKSFCVSLEVFQIGLGVCVRAMMFMPDHIMQTFSYFAMAKRVFNAPRLHRD